MLKKQIEAELKVANERLAEAVQLGIIVVDPIDFFVENIDRFLEELRG